MVREREFNQTFPDKKIQAPPTLEDYVDLITHHQRIRNRAEVGQETAIWKPLAEYPDLPILVVFMSDIHFGNIDTDHELFLEHLKVIHETPNTFVIFGGDSIDNLFPGKNSDIATRQNAISPDMQTQAMVGEMEKLDAEGKLAAIGVGDHEQWLLQAGHDFYKTHMKGIGAPILSVSDWGILKIKYGKQKYNICLIHDADSTVGRQNRVNNHTASAKKLMDELPEDIDIVLSGHSHHSADESFQKGLHKKTVIVGGTYKLGNSNIPAFPGYSIRLSPDRRLIEVSHDLHSAQQSMIEKIFYYEKNRKRKDNK